MMTCRDLSDLFRLEAPMHATGADSGAGTAGNPVFPQEGGQLYKFLFIHREEVMPINPCSFIRKRAAQQIAEDIKHKHKVFKKPAAAPTRAPTKSKTAPTKTQCNSSSKEDSCCQRSPGQLACKHGSSQWHLNCVAISHMI